MADDKVKKDKKDREEEVQEDTPETSPSEDAEAAPETSNFKEGNPDGTRRPGSIIGDSMDVAEKAALTTPDNTSKSDNDNGFEGGQAPGEGTIINDPKVVAAREEREDA